MPALTADEPEWLAAALAGRAHHFDGHRYFFDSSATRLWAFFKMRLNMS